MEAMLEAVITLYELATMLIPFLVAYCIVREYARRTARVATRLLPCLIFVLYIFAVLYVTGVGTLYDLMRYGISLRSGQINLIPFYGSDWTTGYVLNAIMFLPLGILLPLIWPRVARLLPVTAFGFGFSLLIEVSQLLNNRTTDIDDLLMNTLGAIIGFGLYWIVKRIRGHRVTPPTAVHAVHGDVSDRLRFGAGEPALYLVVMFVGHFFLYDGLGVAAQLYGF